MSHEINFLKLMYAIRDIPQVKSIRMMCYSIGITEAFFKRWMNGKVYLKDETKWVILNITKNYHLATEMYKFVEYNKSLDFLKLDHRLELRYIKAFGTQCLTTKKPVNPYYYDDPESRGTPMELHVEDLELELARHNENIHMTPFRSIDMLEQETLVRGI